MNHARPRDVPVTRGGESGPSQRSGKSRDDRQWDLCAWAHTIQLGHRHQRLLIARGGSVTSVTGRSAQARQAGARAYPGSRGRGGPQSGAPHRAQGTPTPVREKRGYGRVSPRGVLAVIGVGAVIVMALWWHSTPAVSGLGGWLTGAGEILGLLCGYGVVVLVALMARLPPLERGIGTDRLARWHAMGGRYVVSIVVAHGLLILWGYAVEAHTTVLSETAHAAHPVPRRPDGHGGRLPAAGRRHRLDARRAPADAATRRGTTCTCTPTWRSRSRSATSSPSARRSSTTWRRGSGGRRCT